MVAQLEQIKVTAEELKVPSLVLCCQHCQSSSVVQLSTSITCKPEYKAGTILKEVLSFVLVLLLNVQCSYAYTVTLWVHVSVS